MSPGRGPQLIERLAGDAIYQDGDAIVIDSAAPMPDWEARNYRRLEILYRGTSYYLATTKPGNPGRQRYVLKPWPDDDPAAKSYLYDREFVEERDRARAQLVRAKTIGLILTPFEPLLGFLPGSWLEPLADNYGVHADRAHGFSVFMEIVVGIAFFATTVYLGPAYGDARGRIQLLSVALIIDGGMRYHHRLAETPYYFAPLEWLFRRR